MNRLDRLLGGCVMVLLAALALRWAVQLLVESWVPLAIAAGIIVTGSAGFAVWRARRNRW